MKKEIWHILKIIDVIIIVISGIPAIVLGTMFEIDHALPEKVFKILNINHWDIDISAVTVYSSILFFVSLFFSMVINDHLENNIFHYVTGELSQDAFLCWLFSFALKDADDEPALKSCAVDFIRQFVPELKNEPEVWLSEEPKRQYKSIDILLTVNDKYKIIIEDKTYTNEHDNQLERYYHMVKADFENYEIKGIYIKIGFQSDMSAVDRAGYKYFGLETILSVLEKYAFKTTNDIFMSYYFYLKQWHRDINQYKYLPVCEWGGAQISGFYHSLKQEFHGMKLNYRYVANQSGGFYGMWLSNGTYCTYQGAKYELYLQCEFANGEMKICYKVSSQSDSKVNQEEREHFIWRKQVNVAEKHGFEKPSRLGGGKTATLGVYNFGSNRISYIEMEKILSDAVSSFKQLVKELDE